MIELSRAAKKILPAGVLEVNRFRGYLVLGAVLYWLIVVGTIAGFAYLDSLRAGHDISPRQTAGHFALGFAPWLICSPLVFLFAWQQMARALPVRQKLVETVLLGLGVFAFIFFYMLFVYAPVLGLSVTEVLQGTRLLQWLWDIFLFVVAYLAGQTQGLRVTQRAETPQRIAVRSHGRTDYVTVEDIIAASAQGNYVVLICRDREYLHRARFAKLLSSLSGDGFVQCHRSHFVRPESVSTLQHGAGRLKFATLVNGEKIPVSERYARQLEEMLTAGTVLSA